MRREMPHPCIAPSARVRRISRSSVPGSRSDLEAIHLSMADPKGLRYVRSITKMLLSMFDKKPTEALVDCQGERRELRRNPAGGAQRILDRQPHFANRHGPESIQLAVADRRCRAERLPRGR